MGKECLPPQKKDKKLKLLVLHIVKIFHYSIQKKKIFKEMATSEEDKKKFQLFCYDGDVDGVTQLLSQDRTLINYADDETGEVNTK